MPLEFFDANSSVNKLVHKFLNLRTNSFAYPLGRSCYFKHIDVVSNSGMWKPRVVGKLENFETPCPNKIKTRPKGLSCPQAQISL